MTDMWFQLKEISEQIKTLQRYSNAMEFIRKVAHGELNYLQCVTEARTFIEHYREKEIPEEK